MLFADKTQLLTAKVVAAGVAFAITSASMSGCTAFTPVAKGLTDTPSHERTLLIADTYASQGHYKKAQALYGDILRRRPHNEKAIAGLARIAEQSGEPGTMIAKATSVAPAGAVVKRPAAAQPTVAEAAPKARITAAPVAIALHDDGIVPPPPADEPVVKAAVKPADTQTEVAATTAVDLLLPEPQDAVKADVVKADVATANASTQSTPKASAIPLSVASAEPAKKTSTAKGEEFSRDGWENEYFVTAAGDETGLDYDLNDVIAAAYGLTEDVMISSNETPEAPEEPAVEPVSDVVSGWKTASTRTVAETPAADAGSGWIPVDLTTPAGPSVSVYHSQRIQTAAEDLATDASDTGAWQVLDENLNCGDAARQSLAVLTMGELPSSCHADVASRLQKTLAFEPNDEVRSAAALALGGLGSAAEPAVPMLREIIQTAAQRPADAARVSLMCLGYEE